MVTDNLSSEGTYQTWIQDLLICDTKTKTQQFQDQDQDSEVPRPRLQGSRPRPRPRLVKTGLETS